MREPRNRWPPFVRIAVTAVQDVFVIGLVWSIWRIGESVGWFLAGIGLVAWTTLWAAGVRKGREW